MYMKIRDEWDLRDQFRPQNPDELALNLSAWNPSYVDTLESGIEVSSFGPADRMFRNGDRKKSIDLRSEETFVSVKMARKAFWKLILS